MSNPSATLEKGAPLITPLSAEVFRPSWRAAKAKLVRFLDALPDSHEDIDPVTLRRLPVPY